MFSRCFPAYLPAGAVRDEAVGERDPRHHCQLCCKCCLSFAVLPHPVSEELLNPYKSQQLTERVFKRSRV